MMWLTKITSLVILVSILPYASLSDQENVKKEGFHISDKQGSHQLSHKLLFQIILHGFLLWASMGILMPVGILTIRMSIKEECGRKLKIMVLIHTTLQICSISLVTAGAILSIKNFENDFNNMHRRMGVTLYVLVWLQAIFGFFRPPRGNRRRRLWFSMHWAFGTVVSLLGIINIYTGLQAYHQKTAKSIKLWTVLLTAEVLFIGFFYLLQEKWDYIQKQGVTMGDDPIVQPINDNPSTKPKIGNIFREPIDENISTRQKIGNISREPIDENISTKQKIRDMFREPL